MYLLKNWHKVALACVLITAYGAGTTLYFNERQRDKTEYAMKQLDDHQGAAVQQTLLEEQLLRDYAVSAGWLILAFLCLGLFVGDLKAALQRARQLVPVFLLAALCLAAAGCRRPFEPVKMETIASNEEAFLLPLTGDGKAQESSSNEDYLKQNLVYTKQVQIPQQWHPTDRGNADGEWKDAAVLIKVDKSPVTREWTADPNTGTSNKNEAIWVMTSDQVEFSTGWTITARIEDRDSAVKFLHNYPNGSLKDVLDTEVRSKLQAVFGLEVTDLPMDELRKNATPHITKTTKAVEEFFKKRGITITNIGITGGFIYKDDSIVKTMVKVFNAEQEKSIAIAETNAQRERNERVILDAQGVADALLKTKKAEADGIKLVADARLYELQQATKEAEFYLKLKQLELQKELLQKWDGQYPKYFMGTGASSPNMLLQLPVLDNASPKKDK